jgi:ABC-2 type transport system ATP-binding protein
VKVFHDNPFANPNIFRRMGYCPEIESLYEEMTGRDFVTMLAAMSGIPSRSLRDRVGGVLERVGMADHADRKIGAYSKGMRQRVKVAQAIVHDPDILIMDEPLNGLDPIGRHEISTLLITLASQGKCVLISSHILYEVEQMTHNILLMYNGRLLAQGDVYRIRALIDSHPHRIAIVSDHARELAKCLLDLPYVLSVHLDPSANARLEIETHSPEMFYEQFPEIVLSNEFKVTQFESPDNNLESVFRYLVKG